jgi:hypothetical protein
MSGSQEDVWVERVLGLRIGGGATGEPEDAAAAAAASSASPAMAFREQWRAVRAAWTEAAYEADQQIGALVQHLRGSGDEDLTEIAEFGFVELMDHKQRLGDAMLALEGADPEVAAKSAPAVLQLTSGLKSFVDSDVRVTASDNNPWGVAVSLRQTLGPVLADMEKTLATAP